LLAIVSVCQVTLFSFLTLS